MREGEAIHHAEDLELEPVDVEHRMALIRCLNRALEIGAAEPKTWPEVFTIATRILAHLDLSATSVVRVAGTQREQTE